MRKNRRRAAIAAASLGAAFLALATLAPQAGAGGALTVYSASSVGRGLETTLSISPMIFQPLAQGSAAFATTDLDSIPTGRAIAAEFYPGDFAFAVVGPGGAAPSAGAPAELPSSAIARYPRGRIDKPESEQFLGEVPAVEEHGLVVRGGHVYAAADLGRADAFVKTGALTLQPVASQPAVVEASALTTVTRSTWDGATMVQDTIARASGIKLLGGQITIDGVVSTARVVSDGARIPQIVSDVTIGRVEVADSAGVRHRAVIDRSGIHIEDPALSRDVNQRLDQSLQYALGKGGVGISMLDQSAITDGPQGESVAGGLLLRWSSGPCDVCKTVFSALPPIPRPPDGTPEPRVCPTDVPVDPTGATQDPTLPCVSPALVPIPPGVLSGTVTLAGVRAFSYGAIEEPFNPPVDFGELFYPPAVGPYLPPSVLGNQYFNTPGTVPQGTPQVTPPGFPGRSPLPPVLLGKVAEMPSGALVAAGLLSLVLAVGLVFAPSLRREASP